MLSGYGDKTFPLVSDMPGCAIYQGTTRPGRRPTVAMVTGSTPCLADGIKCGRTPQGGRPCNAILDDFGRHAGLCNKGLYTRRHDLARDHIAKVAGLTAQIEQKMLIPGQTQEDGEPAPGSVRPLRRADVHVIEPAGSEIWIDVRTHSHGARRSTHRPGPSQRRTPEKPGLWTAWL